MNLLKGILLGAFTLLLYTANGQLEITFPTERAVFQRSNGNATIVYITGHYREKVDRIDARFIPLDGGRDTGWVTIQNGVSGGNYRGSIVVGGGWYRLEVRGLVNSEPKYFSQVNKVGVGEVFLISGQSNAQGYNNYGQPGASDDRVNIVTNYYSFSGDKPSYPTFGKLYAESKIAPTGNGAWCWGKLGDLLASKLNVPILFLNAAWEGFEVDQFVKSSRGQGGVNPYSRNIAPNGYPFSSMTDALHYYTNLLGIRAILWHQGESDNFLRTPTDEYRNKLQDIIYQTRYRTGKDISWMVARVSKTQQGYWQPVIDGQNAAIQSTPNVFYGPNTDNIPYRWDGVHFSAFGLEKLAEAWYQSLNNNFFAYSRPYPGNPPLFLNSFCDPGSDANNPMRIAAPQGYVRYEWSNGSNSNVARLGPGIHQGKAFDSNGNVYYSSPIRIPNDILPSKPNITANGPTRFCQGELVQLTATGDDLIYWNNNQSGNFINVSQAGVYTATAVNFYACGSTSDPIQIENYPTPQPEIIASGPTDICSDDELTLRTNLRDQIEWNTGSTAQELNINQPGKYSVRARNEFGCVGQSREVEVTIREAAQVPQVNLMGPTEFCQDDSTVLEAVNFDRLEWSNGAQEKALTVDVTGIYYAINTNDEGCSAKSNEVHIKVNPRPQKPSIEPQGPTVFCDNKTVRLIAPESSKYAWSTGDISQEIEVNQTADVFLKVENEFGCESDVSTPISITALETPKDPKVIQTGTFTLGASFSSGVEDLRFAWSINDDIVETSEPSLKARVQGIYRVKGFKTYEINSNQSLTCESNQSEELAYVIDESKNGFSVYPNPSINDEVKIETLEDVDNAKVFIYNFSGQLVRRYSVDVFDSVKQFDLKGIPKGNYLVKVKNNRSSFTSKLIIR